MHSKVWIPNITPNLWSKPGDSDFQDLLISIPSEIIDKISEFHRFIWLNDIRVKWTIYITDLNLDKFIYLLYYLYF